MLQAEQGAKTLSTPFFNAPTVDDEVWNRQNATVIDELMTPDIVIHGHAPEIHGRDGFKEFYGQIGAPEHVSAMRKAAAKS